LLAASIQISQRVANDVTPVVRIRITKLAIELINPAQEVLLGLGGRA
jgi:hypothetical protein